MILNWDLTGIRIVLSNNWTMDQQDVKRVEVGRARDKRLITAVFCGSLVGDFLPVQVIYQGKQRGAISDSSFHQSGISHTHKSTGPTKPP